VAGAPETHRMELSTAAAAVRVDMNRQWEQGQGVEAAGSWVRELQGAIPELGDRSARPGSGWREIASMRCLTVSQVVVESWVARR
jgi:hypothetical protein